MKDNNEVNKKIEDFFRVAIKYYGKEIGMMSSQMFCIDQICDEEKERQGLFKYTMQYGFPQSGCVSLEFGYSKATNTFAIDNIGIYAPPAEKEIIMANFAPQLQEGPVEVSVNFGMDMGTQEHTCIQEIEENPNALKMLEIATADLDQAQVLGECRLNVPEGSKRIPCCNSTRISKNKGK